MHLTLTLAAGPWGIGWQEAVMIFLIIGILGAPVVLVAAIVYFILRRQRRKTATPRRVPRAESHIDDVPVAK